MDTTIFFSFPQKNTKLSENSNYVKLNVQIINQHENILNKAEITFSNSKRWNRNTWIACIICERENILVFFSVL